MKNKTKKKITLFAAISVLVLFLASCDELTITFTLSDYTGKAVNVKAAGTTESYWKVSDAVTLESALVSLYAYDSTTGGYSATAAKSATVSSTGSFTFTALEPNMYKLTAVKTGWTFVPRYIEISGSGADFPDLLAYPSVNAGQITLIASWSDTDIDVDAILTYGEINGTTQDWTAVAGVQNPDPGERTKIYQDAVGSIDGIKLDRDIYSATYGDPTSITDKTDAAIPRVETITIYNSDWLTDGDVLFFYLDSYWDSEEGITNPTAIPYQSLTGEEGTYVSAYAQVDVMYGITHYGTWVLPWNTSEDTLKILTIDYNTAVDDTFTGAADFAISSDMANADVLYGGIKSIIWE
ncbi:MAG: hypothetical protein JEZ04_08935 [Spirochaetales bacterium]|nr:hypothetical protein [Spirochaetales bacterium]